MPESARQQNPLAGKGAQKQAKTSAATDIYYGMGTALGAQPPRLLLVYVMSSSAPRPHHRRQENSSEKGSYETYY